jgi:hypothetical protein
MACRTVWRASWSRNAARELHVDPAQGLSAAEVGARLERYGYNQARRSLRCTRTSTCGGRRRFMPETLGLLPSTKPYGGAQISLPWARMAGQALRTPFWEALPSGSPLPHAATCL